MAKYLTLRQELIQTLLKAAEIMDLISDEKYQFPVYNAQLEAAIYEEVDRLEKFSD